MRDNILFFESPIHDVIRNQEAGIRKAVSNLPDSRLDQSIENEVIEDLYKELDLPPIVLNAEGITISESNGELEIPSRGGFIRGREHSERTQATFVNFHVPFEGDAQMFRIQPSSFTFNPPQGQVSPGELVISVPMLGQTASEIRTRFDQEFSKVQQLVERLNLDCGAFNAGLRERIKVLLVERRAVHNQKSALLGDLGFPRR